MGMSYDIAADAAYIRRRAAETGLLISLMVGSHGFTILAVRNGGRAGSSEYTIEPDKSLPAGCLQKSVDMAIANAMGVK